MHIITLTGGIPFVLKPFVRKKTNRNKKAHKQAMIMQDARCRWVSVFTSLGLWRAWGMPVLRGLYCLSREEIRKSGKKEERGGTEAAEGMEHSEWAFGVGKQCAGARGRELEMTMQG